MKGTRQVQEITEGNTMDSQFDPYAAPSVPGSGASDNSSQSPWELASASRRFVNYIIDTVFGYVAVLVAMIVGFVVDAIVGDPAIERFLEKTNYYPAMLVLGLYYVFFEGLWQRTPAKWITGTVVVREDGKRPSFGGILIRSLVRFVPFDGLSFLGKTGVGWHDTWSKTRVVVVGRGARVQDARL